MLDGSGDHEASDFWEGLGGKAAVQAVAAARQGGNVAVVGRVGSDAAGQRVLDRLADEGVDARYVTRDPTVRTERILMLVDADAGHRSVVVRGANAVLHRDNVAAAAPALRAAGMVLAQLEVPQTAALAAFAEAQRAGVATLLDPSPAQALHPSLLAHAGTVRGNAAEAGRITGLRVVDRASAHRTAVLTLGRGPSLVSYQAGDEGDLVVWRAGEQWLPRHPVPAVDPKGAGDAFTATLALGLVRGRTVEEAGRRANAAAALATTALGALPALPTADEISDLLATRQSSPGSNG